MAKEKLFAYLALGAYLTVCPFLLQGVASDSNSRYTQKAYSSYEIIDFYHLNYASSYPQYLISSDYKLGWEHQIANKVVKAEYQNHLYKGKYSQTDHLKDTIELYAPHESMLLSCGWNLKQFFLQPHIRVGENMGGGLAAKYYTTNIVYSGNVSSKEDKADINYSIRDEDGNIPFSWLKTDASIGILSSRLNANIKLTSLSPVTCDSLFDNNIHSSSIGADISYNINKDLQISIQSSYTDIDADLMYKKQQYGDIQNFRVLSINTSLQKTLPHFSYQIGADSYFGGIGSDTYLDIWPFTYLDTFLAHRTRIKQLGIQAISPKLELIYTFSAKPIDGFNFSLGIGYHHLFHKEDVIIRNRKVVLYPFIFTYDTNHYNWQDDINGYFNIPLQASYRKEAGMLEIKLQQLAPIKWSDLFTKPTTSTGEPSDGVKQHQWGGLSCQINLSFQF
ncbi:MAG: hypothetical protein PHY48_04425 [Candidatus Cloacimonetes bacterium]|nr:hypothetical protein [Candidatus Cloacimonadota bacterium]